jgi:hypothetical protein
MLHYLTSLWIINRQWKIYIVDVDGSNEPTTLHGISTASLCGARPEHLGETWYSKQFILIAGCATPEARKEILFHEIGHIIAWATGYGDTNESDANLFALIIKELISQHDLFLDNSL